MSKLAGRAAIVTGAADGLGRAASLTFAKEGAFVLLVDINETLLGETRSMVRDAGGTAVDVVADVSDADQVRNYVDLAQREFGKIDAFFNNAGMLGPQAPIAQYPEDAFDKVIAVDLKGVFLGLRYVLPTMIAQGHGAIVNTGSMGSTGGLPGSVAYAAAKHGVIGLTKTAALEAAPSGVRVNAVLPGNIKTRMALSGTGQDEAAAEAMLGAVVPQQRVGFPQEIADAVLFLVSDDSKHITGIELPVDGGISAQVYPAAATAHAVN